VTELRHPLDPDPVRSTKATAILALGIAAVVAGPLLGGVVPATVALVLARQARGDLRAAQGFLLGGRRVRTGVTLSWVGIFLALGVLLVATIVGLLQLAGGGGHDFAPSVN
jgi:(hydroxyamino)benzene mutase